jgi:hypothetical protein
MSERDARRARWRADLHEYGADALASAGLTQMAETSIKSAASLRQYADLMDRLTAAKAGTDKNALREVKIEVIAFRKEQREHGIARPGVLNDFAEPSDDDLIELGY